MNKTDLIQKVKALDGLSQDERAYLINLVNTKKKYGLVWEDKPEEVEEQLRENLPVLKEVKDKAIVNGEDNPNHILIEGDNLHALTALAFTHEGKIDVVYSDPPYNTGNNSWKYNNRYIDDEDPFKHSKWIAFMEKRLKILKRLLSEDAVVCITIDNYEVHSLRLLMDEIFTGKEIIITVIEHNFRGRAKNNFALTHEYAIWVVPKGKESITRLKEKSTDISRNLRRTGQGSKRHESPTMFYGIEVNKKTFEIIDFTEVIPEGTPLPKSDNIDTEYVFPIDSEGVERRWYYGKVTALSEIKAGHIWAKIIKDRLEIHYWKPGKEKRRKSVWSGPKYDGSTHGSELLTEIIGQNDFPFPKSINAVTDCLEAMSDRKDITILDFFSGSGTTGHAVMKLNAADGGKRKFIMCTNNENNICQQITYPRVHNIIQGYKFNGKEKVELLNRELGLSDLKNISEIFEEILEIKLQKSNEYVAFDTKFENGIISLFGIKKYNDIKPGLSNNNLHYFQCDFVSRESSLKNKKELTLLATELLCIKEDCFTEQKIHIEQAKLFSNGTVTLLILFDDHIIPDAVELLKNMDASVIKVYVFSMGSDPYTEDFADVLEKVTLCALPDAIYKAYQNVLPKKKRTVPLMEEVSETPTNENG
jgi:adenine-specific DNA-methyltransferase